MDSRGLFDKLESHAASLGYAEQVNTFEPKSAPGNGVSIALWVDSVGPARGSGLVSTDALVVFMVRVYSNAFAGPPEAIDPNVLEVVDALFTAYSGDFELGGTVQGVDLLGRSGTQLRSQAGHVRIDNSIYRVVTITVPVIVNEAWDQEA